MAKHGRTVSLGVRKARRRIAESGEWARTRLSRFLQLAYPLQPVPQTLDDLAYAIENEEIARLLQEIEDLESERLNHITRVLSRHHANDN